MIQILKFILLLILLSPGVNAQQSQTQTRQPLNYGFVSPNTRENQKLNDAIAAMSSTGEAVISQRAQNLGCVVRAKVTVFKSLGSWSDGAEQAIVLRMRSVKRPSDIYFHVWVATPIKNLFFISIQNLLVVRESIY
jgi:hypothetical protein